MKKNLMMVYGQTLSRTIADTEDVQKDLEPYYTKLKTAMDADKLADLSDADFADIQSEFQDGTDRYLSYNDKLKKLQAPARFMGKHQTLKRAYDTYANACQTMTDSLNVKEHTVDTKKFAQAEIDQNEAMDRIIRLIQTIMATNA
ncbi:hypothetical protein [Furfurilactobacillus milii]|uniref:Chemotaxis protein n=1 Tax=Furfurilactobacillus milii TaxID=2888272 RepID=A0A6N9I1F9_9LACO|nr:hypothetical protein [Furfurilactobacillus milii]MYV16226.1 hypothetical protein [Furfurilactobacillus milii]